MSDSYRTSGSHPSIVWLVTDRGQVSMIFSTEAAAQAHRDWMIVVVGSTSIDVEVQDWLVLGPGELRT